jgi:glycosyltransferase involved in cell wall biosynthesis/Flp pilus assembly protein TadD
MPRPHLFGPVTAAFADQNLRRHRQAGDCLTFGPEAGVDLVTTPSDTWDSLCARLPSGWRPEFIALELHYSTVPPCLWSAPVPLVGLAADWNLLWHHSRRSLRRCELVLTDITGVETLGREDIHHARVANLFGCERAFLEMPLDTARDIDALFIGNLNPAVQRERLPWLARLARLASRWNVVIRTNVYGVEYRRLLCRSRVVFNRGIRRECNMRTFEAAAAGCLLFQEAGNLEVPAYFQDRQECVYYDEDNLEALLEHYLSHEDERKAIAERAQAKVPQFSFENLWDGYLEIIDREWPGLSDRAARRPQPSGEEELLGRTWQALGSRFHDPGLVSALTATIVQQPTSATLHNALGLAVTVARAHKERGTPAVAEAAAGHFRGAWECDPTHAVAGLNLAEALACLEDRAQAAEQARRVLALLDSGQPQAPAALDAGHFPLAFDHFRVEWERAAWENAGDPAAEGRAKEELLRWRCHTLLAELTGELGHRYEAACSRPDLAPGLAALGAALVRAGRPAEAVPHLRQAVAAEPFDRDSARLLFEALGAIGDEDGARGWAEERRLLSRAAPQVVPPEAWFAAEPATAPPATGPAATTPACVVWEGAFEELHSLALVNRELCRRLLRRGHHLSLLPPQHGLSVGAPALPQDAELAAHLRRPLPRPVDVHVRHTWPPNFEAPAEGRWVLIQPWEFGSLPVAWVDPIVRQVDEVWAYTRHVRDCYVRSGVPEDRVHVVPLGVDTELFRPGAAPLPLKTGRRFKFLFVGGTIRRKGIDLLLEAYGRAFTARDDVCLVIKDMGAGSFYKGQTAEQAIAAFRARPDAPEVEYTDRMLSEQELAGLYAACDCLAHPYRGEGFGLPIAEAMACGLPVIVTGLGAALDFCDDNTAFLVPAREVRVGQKRVGTLETVDFPRLAEPDPAGLEQSLRYVFEHPEVARARGHAAAEHIRSRFTWDHAAAAVERRLEALRHQPIRRLALSRVLPRAEPAPRPPVVPATAATRPVRVSLCILVREHDTGLADSLGSAADLADEVLVLDATGGRAARELAVGCGARVVPVAWQDDGAAARNEALRHARGDWLLWLEAGERLDSDNHQRLWALLASLGEERAAYALRRLSEGPGESFAIDQVRLLRRDPALRWQGRVHEQVLASLGQAGYEVRPTEVVVRAPEDRGGKEARQVAERELALLRQQEAEQPGDPWTLLHLGLAVARFGRLEEALGLLRRGLELAPPESFARPRLFALVARGHYQLGRLPEALAACLAGRNDYPEDAGLLFLSGLLLQKQGNLAGAESVLRRLLALPSRPAFAGMDPGLRGYKGRHLLGEVCLGRGRAEEAEALWRQAVAERPDYLAGWRSLAEFLLSLSRWQELDDTLGRFRLLALNDAALLKARAHLARGEHAEARALLEAEVARAPRSAIAWLLLSRALLAQGGEEAASERALRAVLGLAPGHPEASRNLAILLQRQGEGPAEPSGTGI